MSLLMEALRKAEEEKNDSEPERPAPTTPVDESPDTVEEEDSLLVLDLPDLQESRPDPVVLEALPEEEAEAETAAAAETPQAPVEENPPPTDPSPLEVLEPECERGAQTEEDESKRKMARALFQAKARARKRRLWLGLLAAVSLLLLAALAAWYFLVIQQEQGIALVPAVSPVAPSEPEPVVEALPEQRGKVEVAEPAQPQVSGEITAAGDAGQQEQGQEPEQKRQQAPGEAEITTPVQERPSPTARPQSVAGKKAAVASAPAKPASEKQPRPPQASAQDAYQKAMNRMAGDSGRNPAIQIRRSSRKTGKGSPARKAWQAFHEGRYQEAEQLYTAVLRKEPLNRDALLGLAAIAVATGDAGAAQDFYLRLLERDPRDSLAQAGMVSLQGHRQPAQAIARVQQLIATNPDQGGLHFVLGNLYAAQKRWSYAQQAYFKAYTSDPGNPDYLFNLAVSLDHLGKQRQALNFYRQALEHAQRRRARFSTEVVSRRIEALAAPGDRS